MRILTLLVCTTLLLSGCAEELDPEAPGEAQEPLDAAPLRSNETALPVAPAGVAPRDLSDRTSLYWATSEALGDTALEVVVDFGNDNECEVSSTVAGRTHQGGTHAVFLLEGSGGYMWGASGGGSLATAYAGPVDTRTLLGWSGQYASGTASRGGYSGETTLTRVAYGVEPWDNRISGDKSLSLDIDCKKPFSVLGARVGHEVLLSSAGSMHGVGADVPLAGSALVQATASLDVTAPTGRALLGHFGEEAGRVVVDHPSGQTEWMVPVHWGVGVVDDGPGTYSFTVDRVGVWFEAFWLAAFGLSTAVDLLPGLQGEATYESPF